MHEVFVTEGLVVRKRGTREADTTIELFTKDFGLVRASARSARREVSKLRFGLEPQTLAQYSLVRGRYEWKLIGVDHINRVLLQAMTGRRAQIARILQLLLRLIQGEEPIPGLYAYMIEGFNLLGTTKEKADAEIIECLIVLYILQGLGYVPDTPELRVFIQHTNAFQELLPLAHNSRSLLIRTINQSLIASGL